VPDDLAVDNRALLAALRIAAERAGALFVDAAVAAVLDDGSRVVGVRLADGTECAAAASSSLRSTLAGCTRCCTVWSGR
jgi:glycine oxidase